MIEMKKPSNKLCRNYGLLKREMGKFTIMPLNNVNSMAKIVSGFTYAA